MPGAVFDVDTWWDEDGFWWGLHAALDPVRIPYIERALSRTGPERLSVLDVGCGGGFVLEALERHGFEPTGIDTAPGALRAASTVSNRLLRADGASLPFSDGTFDAVIMSEILEHADDPRTVVTEAARVTRRGGTIVVTGPNRTLRSRIGLVDAAQRWPWTRVLPHDLHEWHRFIKPAELRAWLEADGCRVDDVSGVGLPLRRVPGAIRAWRDLRTSSVTFGEAGRRMGLAQGSSTALAYMATATRVA